MNRTFDIKCIKADPQAGICDTFIPPAATGAPYLLLYTSNNISILGYGFAPQPSIIYFGTQLGVTNVPPASLLPTDSIVNNSGFVENILYSQGGPAPSQGGPVWAVPRDGLYKLSVMVNTFASIDNTNNPAAPGFVGVSSPWSVPIQYAVNNLGFPSNSLAAMTRQWSATGVGETTVQNVVCGETYIPLTTSDFLAVGVVTSNQNSAINISQCTMELLFVQ